VASTARSARPSAWCTPERIDGADANDAAALCTLELTEQGGRTILTQSMRFPTSALRDQALASGMSDGMASSYDRLEQVLDERPRA
jgi:uncharacterized protein YndB with AHSA1/START domain